LQPHFICSFFLEAFKLLEEAFKNENLSAMKLIMSCGHP